MGGTKGPTSASATPAGVRTASAAGKLRKKGSPASIPAARVPSTTAAYLSHSLSASARHPALPLRDPSLAADQRAAGELGGAAAAEMHCAEDERAGAPRSWPCRRAASRAARSPRFTWLTSAENKSKSTAWGLRATAHRGC
jgi:hypothetical protein